MKKLSKEDLWIKKNKWWVLLSLTRIILTPIFLIVRIYQWVWDYDYTDLFIKRK